MNCENEILIIMGGTTEIYIQHIIINIIKQPLFYSDHDYTTISFPDLTEYAREVICNIACFVVRKIQNKVKRPDCLEVLEGKDSCRLQNLKQYIFVNSTLLTDWWTANRLNTLSLASEGVTQGRRLGLNEGLYVQKVVINGQIAVETLKVRVDGHNRAGRIKWTVLQREMTYLNNRIMHEQAQLGPRI